MSMYIEPGELTLRGEPFKCSLCDGRIFTVRHVHNPYGHDMCEDVVGCVACGRAWREYVGKFDRPKTRNAQSSSQEKP